MLPEEKKPTRQPETAFSMMCGWMTTKIWGTIPRLPISAVEKGWPSSTKNIIDGAFPTSLLCSSAQSCVAIYQVTPTCFHRLFLFVLLSSGWRLIHSRNLLKFGVASFLNMSWGFFCPASARMMATVISYFVCGEFVSTAATDSFNLDMVDLIGFNVWPSKPGWDDRYLSTCFWNPEGLSWKPSNDKSLK